MLPAPVERMARPAVSWPTSWTKRPDAMLKSPRPEVEVDVTVGATVSCRALATWLSWPSVLGELPAAPLTPGTSTVSPPETPACRPVDFSDVGAAFRSVINSLLGSYSSIALSVSGGLDSTAVLNELVKKCRERDIKLHLLTADLVGDNAISSAPFVDRIVREMAADIAVHRIVPQAGDERREPYFWSPSGPRFDFSPHLNDAMVDKAMSLGAEAIFTGAGADELIGTVRYMLWSLLLRGQLASFKSYWRDSVSVSRQAVLLESLAPLMRVLPYRWRAIGFYGLAQDPPIELSAPDIVSHRHRDVVEEWSREWLSGRIVFQAQNHRSWAAMEAWESLDPINSPIPCNEPISFLHPFMDTSLVRAVMATPLEFRYNPDLPHAYWRQKAIIMNTIERKYWKYLPTEKQTFSSWMRRELSSTAESTTRLADLGIVDKKKLGECQDAMLLHRVETLERWVCSASSRGYRFLIDH
jgi:asparagine synthetase B (glutamine-hydrolysing)